MNYLKLTLVRAVTSVLKTLYEFHDQTAPQKEEKRLINIKIIRTDINDYYKE